MSHKDEGLKTRHRQYWKKIEADSVVLDPGIIAISWEDSTIRLHDGYTIGGRIFPMAPAPSLTVNVLTPLSGNGSVSSPISLNIAALANQVPVLANAPITGTGIIGNPLDIDTVALATELANAVPVAHDATLVGNGTAGAPLSVNWGLAPAPTIAHNGTLSGAGTPASPLAVVPNSLASLVAVSAISPITGDGKIATPLTLDVAALLPQLHNNVTVVTDGVTVTGSGTTANPLVAVPAVATVVTASPIVGNGTLASPIDINIVSAIAEISAAGGVPVVHNTSLTGNGTTASPLNVDWSQMPALNVQHDGSMTGQGTAGNPLSVNWSQAPAINVNHDGTMIGSGTLASPLSVNTIALANLVPVTVGAGLTGNGTTASPIAPNPSVLGPALSGLVPVAVSAPLTGTGTAASPLGITNATGAARGVVQLATAAEGPAPADEVQATTPAYVESRIGTLVPAATGIVAGKVMLATSTEGAQPLNDSDAATPKYVADVVAAANHAPMTFTSSDGSILNAGAGQALDLTVNPAILGGGSSPAFPMPWDVAVVNNNGSGSSSIRAGYQTIGAGYGLGPYSANPGLGGFVHIAGEQVAQTTDGWHAWPMTATMAELRTPPLNGGVFDFSQGFFIYVDNDTATFTTELNFVGVLVRYNDGADKTVMIGPNNFLGGFLPFIYGPTFTQSTLASMRRPDMKVGTPFNSGGFPVNIFHIGMDIADVIPAGAALISADLVVFWGTSTDSYGGCTQGWSASGSWFARQSGSKTLAQFLASAN